MSELKPQRMWAVYNNGNDLLHWTLAYLKRDAINKLIESRANSLVYEGWLESKAKGYTVRRVTVTPEPEAQP